MEPASTNGIKGAADASVRLEAPAGWITTPSGVPLSFTHEDESLSARFQITVPAIEPILATLACAEWPLFMEPEQKWYRTGAVETGVHQFLVQDPDGYLIRFSANIGQRHRTI